MRLGWSLSIACLIAASAAQGGVIIDEDYAIVDPATTWELNTDDPAHPIVWEQREGRVRLVADEDLGRGVSMIRNSRINPVLPATAFAAEFSFEITPHDPDWAHADGFVFFIGATDPSYLGIGGGSMGWGGPDNTFPSVAIEIDTWRDAGEEYESWSENHIGLAYLPDGNGEQPPRSAYIANPMDFGFPDFEGGGKFTARLEWACGDFSLYLRHPSVTDGRGNPISVLILSGHFPFFVNFIGRPGFTAGTGGAANGVYLYSVRIETIDDSPCDDRGFTYPIRINAGGTTYVDPYGNQWDTDMLLGPNSPLGIREGGGYAGWSSMPIDRTDADRIYQSEWFGDSNWTFHVPDGTYTVILHWSEFATPGERRLMYVWIEDSVPVTLREFSPVRAAGGMFTACQRAYVANVTDGNGLTIGIRGYDTWPDTNAKISAIEVHRGGLPRQILPVAATDGDRFADRRIVSNGPGAIDTNGYIKTWLLLEPSPQDGGGAPPLLYMREYSPFPGGVEQAIASGAQGVYSGLCQGMEKYLTHWMRDDQVGCWFLWVDDDDGISLDEVFRPGDGSDNVDNAMVYAVTYVGYDGRAGDSLPITIGACSDDSILVLVNGEEALIRSVERGWGDPATVQDRGDAVLRSGMNVILAKVFEGTGGFGFRLRLEERGTERPLTANDGISIHEFYDAPIVTISSGRDRILPGEMETFQVSVLDAEDPLVEWDFNAADGLYVEAVGATVLRAFPEGEWPSDRTIVVTASVTVGDAVTTVEKRIVASLCEISEGWVFDEPDPLVWIDEPHHLGRGLEGARLDVEEGKLRVTLPRGVDYDSWTGFDYAPKLLIPLAAYSDFEIETRVTELSRDPNNQLHAGLVLILDETGYVPRPGYLFYGIVRDEIALEQSGSGIPPAVQPAAWVAQGGPPYVTSLRIEKEGTEYRFYYRLSDGEPWTLQLTRTYGSSARHAGVFAKNWGLTGGEFAFDYLRSLCIEPPPPIPEIEVEPPELAFGSVTVGATKPLGLTVMNLGTAPLEFAATLAGGTSAAFRIARILGENPIPPAGEAAITVEYSPTGVGTDEGNLLVQSNDPDEPTVTIPLSGDGVPAPVQEIEVAPPELAFGSVTVGATKPLGLTVMNLGTAPLEFAATLAGGTSAAF
ncbi:MAG: choice-of-anchor D domain-containing protein, partial [Planctomycetes bacterium]|nr:choice-of-anchor D domain-containing protein [Planctomycetota bacterium]